MRTCPQCGYVRKESDAIIKETECPKCGIIYSKWQKIPESDQQNPAATPQAARMEERSANKGISIEKKLIAAALGVVVLVVAVPYIIKQIRIWQNNTEIARQMEPERPINRPSPIEQAPQQQTYSHNTENSPQRELSVSEIVRESRDSIVVVRTPNGGFGSGFFINSDGSIVTNRHVLSQASGAEIKTARGNTYRVTRIIHEDAEGDLVIAATDAPAQDSRPLNVSGRLPNVGEKIVVIGTPMGLELTVSDGIVSAVRRNQSNVEFIQITAPVSSGNSGGPLLNMYGEVIGVTTFQVRNGQNLNFCVAASRLLGLQNGMPASYAHGSDINTPDKKDVYCYADANGKVTFVTWKTNMLVTRPDGSLDRTKYERWVLEQIGGNPDNINPEREARDDLERNRERLFKSVFPHRSYGDTNLTPGENDWLERRYQRHYVEVYNQAMIRRNEAIRKYRSMMVDFEAYAATRRS